MSFSERTRSGQSTKRRITKKFSPCHSYSEPEFYNQLVSIKNHRHSRE